MLPDGGTELVVEEVWDVVEVGFIEVVLVVGCADVVVVDEVELVFGVVDGGGTTVLVVVGVTVVVGAAGAVPRDGVAEQVLTCRPAVRDTRPSCPNGSENPGGRVPTYALKL